MPLAAAATGKGGSMIVRAKTWEERAALVAYLASKIGINPEQMVGAMPFEVFAVTHGGTARGAVLYTNKRRHSIEMTWAGEPDWLTRGNLHDIFAYPFRDLGCLVAFGMIDASNARSIDLAERLGCRKAGVVPHIFGAGKSGFLYCMQHDSCRWLNAGSSARHADQMNEVGFHGQRCA
jgi:hypothetical protein